jgi:rubrerythrin
MKCTMAFDDMDYNTESIILAKQRCLKCGFTWESIPDATKCPVCNGPLISWENQDEMVKNNGI